MGAGTSHHPLPSSLDGPLENLRTYTSQRLEGLDIAVNGISRSMLHAREQAHEDTLKLAGWLERAHKQQLSATQQVFERVEVLQGAVGQLHSLHGENTLAGRLQRIECVLQELMENINDPDAARDVGSFSTGAVAAINTSADQIVPAKQFKDAGTDAHSSPLVDIEVQTNEPTVFTSEYADVGIDATEHTSTAPLIRFQSQEVVDMSPDLMDPWPVAPPTSSGPSQSSTAIDPTPSATLSASGHVSAVASSLSSMTHIPLPRGSKGKSKMDTNSRALLRAASPPRRTNPSPQSSLSSLSSLSLSPPKEPPSTLLPLSLPLPRRNRAPPTGPVQMPVRTASLHSEKRALSRSVGQPRGRQPSPDLEIIERPVISVQRGKTTDVNAASKSVERLGETHTSEVKGVDRPHKRRKTEGNTVDLAPVKRKLGRPRKTLDVVPAMAPSALQPVANSSKHNSISQKPKLPRSNARCKWPEMIEGDAAFQREFVQCDNCDAWYHFGCVGLIMNDPRLESETEYTCPPCQVSQQDRERRHMDSVHDANCARPDCHLEGTAEPDTKEWFVDRIIGRRPQAGDNVRRADPEFLWLVKWDGFTVKDATWEMPGNLGSAARYIDEFKVAAELEGHSLLDLWEIVVLNEAQIAGW